ncbi:MAG: hypothetical protein FWF10_08755 [Clostridiales bacterium]|nr:hypothetical protein [Clostridiales bacterium]
MRTEWRKRAHAEAKRYREYTQYLRGYEEGSAIGQTAPGAKYAVAKQKLWAMESVRAYLDAQEPEICAFAYRYYGWDDAAHTPLCRRTDGMQRWAMEQHKSLSSLYKWRETTLDLLALALCQAGLLKVF